MSKDAKLERLLALPQSERARLASELVQSLEDTSDEGAASAWLDEIGNRARSLSDGSAVFEDWQKVRSRIEARLKRR